ncbi:type II toxin-antitoxin system VapC family toxin [Streptomyces hainanensis]|uniref:PIN domain-containing protein n=1 Tax=Streptomyces hainanensis TaxID=402648 RepID=A0A4R4TL30_9ACTN|nr:type II toxin-antitoxin system VapC family toxin [Streptomyces hainanensis]TDC78728.1 PIN domain-containing protein [Streptomyces hainanensis]
MIVVDCSALVHALADTGHRGRAVRERLDQEDALAAPSLLDTEILSALVRLARRSGSGIPPRISQRDRDKAMDIYRQLPLQRHEVPTLWPRMVQLASDLSVHDAAYTALAEALSVPLVTSDARIARGYGGTGGASRCLIETL